jgi:hypothetical protein
MSKSEAGCDDKDGEGLIERLRNLPRLSVCVEAADCIEKLERENLELQHDLERATANHATDLTPRSAGLSSIDPMEYGRLSVELRAIERHLDKAGVRRLTEQQATSDRVYDLIHNGAVALSATERCSEEMADSVRGGAPDHSQQARSDVQGRAQALRSAGR